MSTSKDSYINLDANASLGLLPDLRQGLISQLDSLGLNPNSVHQAGQSARALVEQARADLKNFVGASRSEQLIFSSGATESNNSVIAAVVKRELRASKDLSKLVIAVGATEHPSILEPALELESFGATVQVVPVCSQGKLDCEYLAKHIDPNLALASFMYANNENGIVNDLGALAEIVRANNSSTIFHSDCVQALGKTEFNFASIDLDIISLSGHKIGALTGVGALIAKEGILEESLLLGGPQEQHRRAGTENVSGIVSFGLAAQHCLKDLSARLSSMRSCLEYMRAALTSGLPAARIVNDFDISLPNTISLMLPGLNSDDLVVALDRAGILASAGAACASGKPEPSHVLLAMGLSEQQAKSVVRFSFSPYANLEEIKSASKTILDLVAGMQR